MSASPSRATSSGGLPRRQRLHRKNANNSDEPYGLGGEVLGEDEDGEVMQMPVFPQAIFNSPPEYKIQLPEEPLPHRAQSPLRDLPQPYFDDNDPQPANVILSPLSFTSAQRPASPPRRHFSPSQARGHPRGRHGQRQASMSSSSSSSSDNSADKVARVSKKTLKPWAKCLKKLNKFDNDLVRGWKEDIDNLLILAGLFSAVLTAFIIDSYKLLQQDSAQASASLLQIIANHLLGDIESTITSTSRAASEPSSFAVRINILWFTSLVFSLSSASVGILAKQWLREYTIVVATSPRQAARIRQFRYTGLIRWHIPEIIAFLPVMVQIALSLFFAGLLDLLWQLNSVVAAVITFFTSFLLVFVGVTTILPSISRNSPHRSPQALAVYLLCQWVIGLAVSVLLFIGRFVHLGPPDGQRSRGPMHSLGQSSWRKNISDWLQKQLHRRQPRNWMQHGRFHVAQQEPQLEHRLLVDADAFFIDDKVLSRVIRPCIREMEKTSALECLMDILLHRADKIDELQGLPTWQHKDVFDRGTSALLSLTVDVLGQIDPADQETMRVLRMCNNLCTSIPLKLDDHKIVRLYRKIHEALAVFLSGKFPVEVIEHVIEYAHAKLRKSESTAFYRACSMALKLVTSSKSDRRDSLRVYEKMQILLKDLEKAIDDHRITKPSAPFTVTVLEYINRYPHFRRSLSGLTVAFSHTLGRHGDQLRGKDPHIGTHRDTLNVARKHFSPERVAR
ncbi:hypothetical protein BDW22DRAFT_1431516 [Trametopsis cervina]|nr:hypothetical protein BDW22DRAFT_1431516 [Trametopsis cervina]